MAAPRKPANKAPVFGRWEAIRAIGRGGFGITYEVKHLDQLKFAIVKVINSDHYGDDYHDYVRRFNREMKILSELNHPNICRLLEANFDSSDPWFVMERYKGNTVYEELEQYGPAPEKIWFDRARDILEALEYAHSKKIIHGDLNPGNIIIDGRGAKLIDFGIARRDGNFASNSTRIFGANGWTSPEHGTLEPSIQDDIFVAASLLVLLGTGHNAFKANTVNNFLPSIINDAPDYSGLSTNQIQLLRKMHQKARAQRCTASQALADINRLEPNASARSIVPHAKDAPNLKRFIEFEPGSAKKLLNPIGSESASKYRGLTISSIFMGGIPLITYWIVSKMKRTMNFDHVTRTRLAYSAAAYVLSFGIFPPVATIWWGRRLGFKELRKPLILQIITAAILLTGTIAESNQEASTFLSVLRIIGTVIGVFGYRKVVDLLRHPAESPTVRSAGKIKAAKHKEAYGTWDEVEDFFTKALASKRGKRFIFEIESDIYRDIYFQGYSEPDASRTIEAAADLSVRPKLSDAQKLAMSAIGWDLPSEDLPNFIMFLDKKDSDDQALSEIFVLSLRDGYGLELGAFRVIAPSR